MRVELLGLGLLAMATIDGAAAAGLKVSTIARPARFSDAVIVGRAVCSASASTWLLSETRHLTEVRYDGLVTVHNVTGLAATERPWGLACLSDGTLWTLAAFRVLARLDETGRLQERIDLHVPRTALFAVGDRLLFQPAPAVPGLAALMTSPARQPFAVKPWAGLVVPGSAGRSAVPNHSLAACGINLGSLVPCWLAPDAHFTISDGITSRTIDAWLQSMPVDRETPIRDVALTSATAHWLLAGGRDAERGRTSGVRLFRVREHPSQNLFIDLKPSARIILSASDTRCVLLTVDGGLMEVVVTP